MWMREQKSRLLVIWGSTSSRSIQESSERYRNDMPDAEGHVVDGSHFALDTAADEIAELAERCRFFRLGSWSARQPSSTYLGECK